MDRNRGQNASMGEERGGVYGREGVSIGVRVSEGVGGGFYVKGVSMGGRVGVCIGKGRDKHDITMPHEANLYRNSHPCSP